MAYAWDAIKYALAAALTDATGVSVQPDELVEPPDPTLGDLAFACFTIAKTQKKNPANVAQEVATILKERNVGIASAVAMGPYVNVTLKTEDIVPRIVKDVENHGAEFGRVEIGEKKRIMLEYAQPNTHKEIHVGHLRNVVLGSSLARLLRMSDWDVITASYHGDVGAHVAKCLWFFVRKNVPSFIQSIELNDKEIEKMLLAIPLEKRTGKYLGEIYAESTRALEEDPNLKTEVSVVQQKLETRDPAWEKLWQETRRWSLNEMRAVFEDLSVDIDRQYFESEVVDEGQRIVDDLLKDRIARESQGAVVVDLENQKLGIFLIRKSDGTSLYATKDLALAQLKFTEYPMLERSMMVVDNRQSLYFKQLFATLKLMGFLKPLEFIGYEFVTLKGGAMSSREGNIITWQQLRTDVFAYAAAETQKRHPDWNEGKVTHTAWCLMMGGVKFDMLRQDSDKMITFDAQKALSFDGATGPYVQYALIRLGSVLRKAGWTPKEGMKKGDCTLLTEHLEKQLVLCLARFPGVVARAATELRPSLIAQWCLEMASVANAFYRDVKIIGAGEGIEDARLRLIASVRSGLTNGLSLLGIPIPDEM